MSLTNLWINAITSMNAEVASHEQAEQSIRHNVEKIANSLEEDFLNMSLSFSEMNSYSTDTSIKKDRIKNDDLYLHLKPPEFDYRYIGCTEAADSIMDNIVSARIDLYSLAGQVKKVEENWTSLRSEIEELEARALTVLTLPSTLFDESNETELILKRLESQALACLQKGRELLRTGSTKPSKLISKTSGNASRPTLTDASLENLEIFPSFDQARSLQTKSTDVLYPILSDYAYRPVTLKIKRMVSCACSQISRHDPKHSINRLNYILTILNGQALKDPDLTSAPGLSTDLLISYAWQCLYAAAVSQAEFQFTHNKDSALVFASLLSAIFASHPDRLTEFLGRLFLACPGLGLFIDPTNGLKLMNEMLSNSEILSRWRGIARLFASLLLAHPPPSLQLQRPRYLNPRLLWTVVAGILNQKFVPCGTAEILHGLLEVGGNSLIEFYGNQGHRLMNTIKTTIESSSELRMSSPEIALLSTLEKNNDTKSHSKSLNEYGLLSVDFWTSN